ncbi:MAG: hypothetical protein AAF699_11175, partial [Pseudomonadota bacterium]
QLSRRAKSSAWLGALEARLNLGAIRVHLSGHDSAHELNQAINATGSIPKRTRASEYAPYPTGRGAAGYSHRFKGQALSSTR